MCKIINTQGKKCSATDISFLTQHGDSLKEYTFRCIDTGTQNKEVNYVKLEVDFGPENQKLTEHLQEYYFSVLSEVYLEIDAQYKFEYDPHFEKSGRRYKFVKVD